MCLPIAVQFVQASLFPQFTKTDSFLALPPSLSLSRSQKDDVSLPEIPLGDLSGSLLLLLCDSTAPIERSCNCFQGFIYWVYVINFSKMFDCGYKAHYMDGQREKFLRLDDLDSRPSPSSDAGLDECGFSMVKLSRGGYTRIGTTGSFKRGMRMGSEGLKSIGRSLGFGVSRAVFPEDLKVSEKKIFDPQDKFLLLWNKLFVISCILAVSIDPLFFYLPVINDSVNCLGIDRKLAIIVSTIRTIIDAFYLIRMALQFRTAYIAPSSRVFGRGELVIDPSQIAKRYMQRYFIIDFLSVLPLPQIVVWRFLQRSNGSDVLSTKEALLFIILLQYVPRFLRMVPLTSELKRTAGVFAETAWAGAAYYLLLYMLASHIVGAFWYLLAVERNDSCWQKACSENGCNNNFLYCGNQLMEGYSAWQNRSKDILHSQCSVDPENPPFDYGIFTQAFSSGIVSSKVFISKYCYCLWWGLQNLSTLGQGLQTSTYVGEVVFSIALAIFGLILFALLIGNMQVPIFESMDESLLDAICERLKPCLFTENAFIVREGDPVDEMLFIIRGRLESVTTDGGRSGFFNRTFLKETDFCGEELLTWALDPKSGSNLPSSTRTVKTLAEVEAFALISEDLKFVASQFRRLHSRQVQHTFRFYSQQWRTWAACFIQAAWRRYCKRKIMELRRKEECEESGGVRNNAGGGSYSIRATFLASRFAANALRGVHRSRNAKTSRELVTLRKPPEPDFTADE
ncbi:probable cyclic nucleotide-gated ion channel 5 isoform X2 [Prosopis cineraria]|uniref:probable cyclic nucleotide-gated ion channel 5 isoform X2 n=1 Tax=Prosopis cineraria TaxID=364024 RepID=UPI00240FF266|nr:probable cyclic nucleotide-gated ion channel 5 isoform X2 [Prosopis cineraria]